MVGGAASDSGRLSKDGGKHGRGGEEDGDGHADAHADSAPSIGASNSGTDSVLGSASSRSHVVSTFGAEPTVAATGGCQLASAMG